MELTTKDAETKKEWEEAVKKNDDSYGRAVIEVVSKVGTELDNGKTPAEAEEIGIKDSGITGFQAGAMAHMLYKLHPRGEEFKQYFNKNNGGSGEEEGTIDPATFIIESKDE